MTKMTGITITEQRHFPEDAETRYRGSFPKHPGWDFEAHVSDDPNAETEVWFSDGRLQEVELRHGNFRVWGTHPDYSNSPELDAMFIAVRSALEPPAEAIGLQEIVVDVTVESHEAVTVKAKTPEQAEAIARRKVQARINSQDDRKITGVTARPMSTTTNSDDEGTGSS